MGSSSLSSSLKLNHLRTTLCYHLKQNRCYSKLNHASTSSPPEFEKVADDVPTSGICRPLSEILKELNKKVPDSLIKTRIEKDGFPIRYIPWYLFSPNPNPNKPKLHYLYIHIVIYFYYCCCCCRHVVNRVLNLHAPGMYSCFLLIWVNIVLSIICINNKLYCMNLGFWHGHRDTRRTHHIWHWHCDIYESIWPSFIHQLAAKYTNTVTCLLLTVSVLCFLVLNASLTLLTLGWIWLTFCNFKNFLWNIVIVEAMVELDSHHWGEKPMQRFFLCSYCFLKLSILSRAGVLSHCILT